MRHTDEEYAYWLNTDEEESYKDHKIKGNLLFPEYNEELNGEVTITYIDKK